MITPSITSNICGRAGPYATPPTSSPAILEPTTSAKLITSAGTYIVPALITVAGGDRARWRYVEFFAANLKNDHTWRASARACRRFFAWCDDRGLSVMSNA